MRKKKGAPPDEYTNADVGDGDDSDESGSEHACTDDDDADERDVIGGDPPDVVETELHREEDADVLHPWTESPIKLRGSLLDKSGAPVPVALVPVGCTVLRRVTFPVSRVRKEGGLKH